MRLMLLALMFLPSCTFLRSMAENAERVREAVKVATDVASTVAETVGEVRAKYDEIAPMIGSITAQVSKLGTDQDGDGDTDIDDWLLALGITGGVGGTGGIIYRNKKSGDAKTAERERAMGVEAAHDKRLAMLEAKG